MCFADVVSNLSCCGWCWGIKAIRCWWIERFAFFLVYSMYRCSLAEATDSFCLRVSSVCTIYVFVCCSLRIWYVLLLKLFFVSLQGRGLPCLYPLQSASILVCRHQAQLGDKIAILWLCLWLYMEHTHSLSGFYQNEISKIFKAFLKIVTWASK